MGAGNPGELQDRSPFVSLEDGRGEHPPVVAEPGGLLQPDAVAKLPAVQQALARRPLEGPRAWPRWQDLVAAGLKDAARHAGTDGERLPRRQAGQRGQAGNAGEQPGAGSRAGAAGPGS
jgi:hypothetical protein